MNRREMLFSIGSGFSTSLLGTPACLLGQEAANKTRLGVCIHSYMIRPKLVRSQGEQGRFADPLNFLEYCHRLGAGGVQVGLGVKEEAYISKLRRQAELYEMFIEGIAGLPRDRADVERFEAEVRTAQQAGAKAIRVVMIPGRRYETFDSAEQFRQFAERGIRSLELAEPVAARHRIPLAVENHKDQRVPERLEVLKHISSQYVGVCVDTGNSIALLEDPMEVVQAYAQWAYAVHLKDAAVGQYEEGFLLADVPLGEGFLDLPRMVQVLRQARPEVQFTLEMITRDPLPVPCLTEKYWATFADVPGRALAGTLRMVRANASAEPLPRVSHLSLDEQIEREEENVKKSLAYARDHLGL